MVPCMRRSAGRQHTGRNEIWNGVLAFGNPDVSRPELLAQFEQMVRRFPSSQYAKLAAETVTTLKRMIQEDKEHADHLPIASRLTRFRSLNKFPN